VPVDEMYADDANVHAERKLLLDNDAFHIENVAVHDDERLSNVHG